MDGSGVAGRHAFPAKGAVHVGEPSVSSLAQVDTVWTVSGAMLAMVADAVVLDHCDELQHRLRGYDFKQITCTAENSKALNMATLERELLKDGAFMVWEILPPVAP